MNAKVEEVPSHLERALGPIASGWTDGSSTSGIQIVAFEDTPEAGVTTYSTLGLNRHLLHQQSGVVIRQEILTSVEFGQSADVSAKMLFAVAEMVVRRGSALAKGQLLSLGGGANPRASSATFLCTAPSPLDHRLVETQSFDPPLVFVYLIALLDSEADLIRVKGAEWFEDQLEVQNPNIWDVSREAGIQSP